MLNFKKYKTKEIEEHENQYLRVQDEIAKLPAAQQEAVHEMQRIVDCEIAAVNRDLFSEEAFALDTFFATHGILGNYKDEFMQSLKTCKKGKTFTFTTKFGYKSFYRSFDDKLMASDDYIYTLEASVMHKNKQELEEKLKKYFTSLSILSKIKLSFKLFWNY